MEGRRDTAKGPIFALDIGGEGAGRLREVVKTKLSDFMGTYTDDVLAEYVVVLVGHGKHQTQATKDLEAFLGDQSDKFVSWLWEHVNSHIHLYISGTKISQSETDLVDNDAIEATTTEKQMSSFVEQKPTVSDDDHHTASEKEVPRDYVIRSSVVKAGSDSDDTLSATIGASCGQDTRWTAKRPWSPSNMDLIKVKQANERRQRKRFSCVPNANAPRRLLQSAVRDAVGPSLRPSQPRRADPSTKRLRSVVLADIVDAESKIFEHSESEGGMATVVSTKASSGLMSTDMEGETQMGSVWDRLRKGPTRYVGIPKIVGSMKAGDKNSGKGFNFEDALQQETDRDRVSMEKRGKSRSVLDRISRRFREDENACLEGRMFSSEGGGEESEFCEDASFNGPFNMIANDRLEPTSREESVTVQYRLAQNMEKTKDNGDMDQTSVVDPTNPQKIVSISVNVNTWKHPTLNEQARLTSVSNHYQDHQNDKEKNADFPKTFDAKETELRINSIQDVSKMKERIQQVEMEMAKLKAKQAEVTNEVQKTAIYGSLAQRSEDDINECMIFVSNVHFAATKETLAAHFSRCGEIARVLLLADETNGQPKGSAYLEFSSKDGAEKALSLNESSFLSRVLKVVRKDATVTEAILPPPVRSPIPRRVTPSMPMRAPPRPRFLRGSPYIAPRFPATSWPPSYGRPTNMQWKRDSPSANQPSAHIRSFSYVRSTSEAQEQKEPTRL